MLQRVEGYREHLLGYLEVYLVGFVCSMLKCHGVIGLCQCIGTVALEGDMVCCATKVAFVAVGEGKDELIDDLAAQCCIVLVGYKEKAYQCLVDISWQCLAQR